MNKPRAVCRSKRKPRLTIVSNRSLRFPWIFAVKYPNKPWKNSHWHTWDEALIALGLQRY